MKESLYKLCSWFILNSFCINLAKMLLLKSVVTHKMISKFQV